MQGEILTWKNLWWRGLTGPSRFPLCESQEETINHLLKTYDYTNKLWEWAYEVFKAIDRDRVSIHITLENWLSNVTPHPVVNKAWNILLETICWIVWTENNTRTFKNGNKSEENLLTSIKKVV